MGNIKILVVRYERHLTTLSFIAGFVWDNLTLKRIDLLFENAVLSAYLAIAAVGIVLANVYEAGRLRLALAERIAPFLPLFIQFAFGALFSGYVVFYSRSASLVNGWPFLVFLLFLFLGNEFFRKRYQRLVFQMSVFFIAAFSYSIFLVPVLVKQMGVGVFIASGLASLVLVHGVVSVLKLLAFPRFAEHRRRIWASVGSLYILFNALYFANVIPPIPLSLKDIGVHHFVSRTAPDTYAVRFEPVKRFLFFEDESSVFHRMGNEPVYVFSAVFAPTALETTISHRWSQLSTDTGRWTPVSTVSFPIVGGRDGGYRGYSVKERVAPGRWRVDVVTARGTLIGRTEFTVVNAKEAPLLASDTR